MSSKHFLNLTTCALSTLLCMRISVRIFCLARSFSSVLLATTFAAKDSPVLGSCMENTTANPPLPSGRPRTYERVRISPVRASLYVSVTTRGHFTSLGRSLLGLGLRDDIVESFGRSVSGAARDGVRRTIDRNTRGGRDARGRYRRRVASADVLFLLLGLGRGVFGFRRGRDVLLVVRHRGARRGLHRARARFERGSPSADATRFLGGAARRRPGRRRARRGCPFRRARPRCRLVAR